MHRRVFFWTCFLGIACLWTVGGLANDGRARRVRILSYNIHHGEGTDGRINLERIAKVIRSASPDLVALQEVDRKTDRSGGVDQPAELARLTGMEVVFGRNITYQGGGYGNAVLSRLAVKRSENHPLPSLYEGEQRGVLEAEIQLAEGGPQLLFLATHLDYRRDDRERLASTQAIEALLRKRNGFRTVLAGDLNATPESRVIEAFERTWGNATGKTKDALTFPSDEPSRQIDYVLFRPANGWKVVEVRVVGEAVASDHRPILAVLEFQP
jgi:endonuclease/exonuclease/phosphatase family metal-dependent hydrolase